MGLISALITFLLSILSVGELIELKGYDLWHLFKAEETPEDIVIIAIDEPSFAEIGLQWPWPRSIHAKLIDTLKQEGVSAIGFDIIFSEPSSRQEDEALSDSIKKAGNAVLAYEVDIISRNRYVQEMVVQPIPLLRENAITGIVSIFIDREGVVRRLPQVKEGRLLFAEQVTRLHSKRITKPPRNDLLCGD